MSIIYDALKKSQQVRSAKIQVTATAKPRVKRKDIILTLLILSCLFAIIASIALPESTAIKMSMFSQNAPVIKHEAPVRPIVANTRLMLEGVFLSDTEKLAMINHHTYHEGDRINGMKVVSINFDQVKLKNKSRSITLRSALTQLD